MKLFGIFALIGVSAAAKSEKVPDGKGHPTEVWCGANLHDTYGTDASVMQYLRINKKFESNPERPRRPGHWRVVVRPVCIASARRGGKPGGYPNIKASPVIKCTMKGPGRTEKLKPNGRRYDAGSKPTKVLEYQQNECE